FFFSCFLAPRALHSFPTRRSSDLNLQGSIDASASSSASGPGLTRFAEAPKTFRHAGEGPGLSTRRRRSRGTGARAVVDRDRVARSEEHTSELQSLRHLVCRLLLEK